MFAINKVPAMCAALVACATALALAVSGATLTVAWAAPGATGKVTVPAAPAAKVLAAQVGVDGLTEATAAASCWEIKQLTPQAPSGIYWLATPAMGGPQEFYCDQDRAGGGWVLVGRGREGWAIASNGSGTPAQVSAAVTGPEAFTPRQLSAEVIGQLLNGAAVKSLADGVRVVRAKNVAGTSWQDATFQFSSPRAGWTWQFASQQRVGSYRFDSAAGSGGMTTDFGLDSSYNRMRFTTGATEGWMMGFGFGSQIRGNPAASSYLWSKDTSTGYARPFTQVFLRPKLVSQDLYTPIPDAGTPARTIEPVADSFAQQQPWSVAGLAAGPTSIEGNNEVAAFTEDAGKVYVGGNFATVQKTAAGAGAVAQSYLAAFDRATGEFVPGFRPTFNSSIRALATLPGNRIAVGGFFTQVNGQPHAGLVVLNGSTGATDTQFTGRLINYLSGGVPIVRALDVQGGWLYAAGTFTHATGGSTTQERYMRAAARFSVTDGTPAADWNPELNGTAMAVDASDRGDRVYFAGYFSQSRGRAADKGAAVSATNNDLYPWQVHFSNVTGGRTGYQQAVKEVGDTLWLGGAEHSLVSYDRTSFAVKSTSIGYVGGDFQAIATSNGYVYGGCHCFEAQYEGATQWPGIGTGWAAADAVYGTGAWNAQTGMRAPQFNGAFNTNRGAGSWALFVDSGGVLWQGGDYSYSTRAGYVRQWSNGFTRHVIKDATAPSAPTAVTAVRDVAAVKLAWKPATDNQGVTGYEVLRDDRVVATVKTESATLPPAGAESRYFVRALDAAGNRSASTAFILAADPPATPLTATYVEAGDTWSYLFTAAGPTGPWTSSSYNASTWATGAAPFGWGQTGTVTPLVAAAPVPVASFYRKTFNVADASRVASVTIKTRADDGVVVYLNGTEIGRKNITATPATAASYATSSPAAAAALADTVTITVPGEMLVTGTNTLAASVHSGYRATPSHSFDLQATAELSAAPVRDEVTTVVPYSADWAYAFAAAPVATEWNRVAFDAASWPRGGAPLGWGHTDIATPLAGVTPVPITSYFRTSFEVADAAKAVSLELSARIDDGAIVYVNGIEVGRANMAPGAVSNVTYALSSPSATYAAANPVTIQVPGELLVTGANVIAVEVHSGYRGTPSHSLAVRARITVAATVQRATQVIPPALTPAEVATPPSDTAAPETTTPVAPEAPTAVEPPAAPADPDSEQKPADPQPPAAPTSLPPAASEPPSPLTRQSGDPRSPLHD